MYRFIFSEEEILGYNVYRFIEKKTCFYSLKCERESYSIAGTLAII